MISPRDTDFEIHEGVLVRYRGSGGEITIPAGVREIGDGAFFSCKELQRVTMPDGLTAIGDRAFSSCEQLSHIQLPQGVIRIGSRAFQYCWSLTGLSLPETVTEIGDEAFYGCYGLKQMAIPAKVTGIGPKTFAHCMALRRVALPTDLQRIEPEAFWGCTALADVTIPEGVTAIGSNAFYGCAALTSIQIPDSVRDLGPYAFAECTGLRQAAVSDCVASFSQTFSGCTGLQAYIVSDRSRRYRAEDGVVFSRDGRKLIAYPPGRRCLRYDIPDAVTEVGAGAFSGASAQVILVPAGVKTFSPLAAEGTGDDDPFVACARAALAADLGKPIYLGPVEDLPIRQRWRALDGFLFARQVGLPEMAPWQDSYLAYVQQEYAACEKKAWKDEPMLRLLMEQRLLRPDTARNMLRKYYAAKRADLIAALSAYLEPL